MERDRRACGHIDRRADAARAPIGGAGVAAERGRTEHDGATRGGAVLGTVQDVVDTLLVIEQLMSTLYYAALTTRRLMHSPALGGSSADPTIPGLPPDGNPRNVHLLQAALDAEVKHAAAAANATAMAGRAGFYFPAAAFDRLGGPSEATSFLGLLDALETMCVGIYIAAARQFLRVGRPDLARVASQIMGVEAEHRMMGRVIGAARPANNLTLQRAPYASVGDVDETLRPFMTGRGFTGGTMAIAVPTAAQADRVIGRYHTRVVTSFR